VSPAPPKPARRHSLRFELAAALALVLMMAVVSFALAGEWLAGRRHATIENERLRQHARGLALVVTPMIAQGAPAERGDVEQALRPSIGSSGIAAIEVYRLRPGEPPVQLASLGLAPEALPPATVPPGEDALDDNGAWTVVDRPLRTFGPRDGDTRLLLRVIARRSTWTSAADWQEIALLALGVGLISFVLGVGLLELQVIRPLAALRDGVRDVAAGNIATRVAEEGPTELRAFAGAFNDMTARLAARLRELEQQRTELARAEQLAGLGRIAAGTAHEVGNPLATILGYVELLLDSRHEPALDGESREMLVRVREQIMRIQLLVGQLLDYSRAAQTRVERLPLRDSTERMLALLRHDPRCSAVQFSVVGPEVEVEADAAKLDQVLQNLLVNAARAARQHQADTAQPHPPEVAVRIEVGDVMALEIQDNGPGVAPAIRDRLFQPFVTTAKAGEGTGLGLAISAGLVERMGGTLVCLPDGARVPLGQNDSPGAVFRVTLRAATRGETQANATPSTAV
jgi:two-component system, NtrC family, sensor kinase